MKKSCLYILSDLYLQDGMLKHKNTYEIISPEDIGLLRSNESGIVLGKLRCMLYYSLAPISASSLLSYGRDYQVFCDTYSLLQLVIRYIN